MQTDKQSRLKGISLTLIRVCGLLGIDVPSDAVMADIVTLVYLKHGDLSDEEIFKSFIAAAEDKLDVDVNMYGRPLTYTFVARTIRDYVKYQNSLPKLIMPSKIKELDTPDAVPAPDWFKERTQELVDGMKVENNLENGNS